MDYTDDIILNTEPRNRYEVPIQYATSREDAENLLKNMSASGELQGRFWLTDFLFSTDNSEEGKKDRQKQIRYLHKNRNNKWKEININTLDGDGNWNKRRKLKVLIHGFTSDTDKTAKELIKAQYIFKLGEGPLFNDDGSLPSDTSKVLDKSDADFVDILHCNMGSIVTSLGGALGSTVVAGTVDFYLLACSHQTSVAYFIESINNPVLACPCADWESYTSGNCTCTADTGGTFMGDGSSERF
ncbi:unnamed protein product [Orchesella dallaii]|uniref:Uncharacterized protein n=1 Tax=Orchesella dallaii TaxID=48710 RepID=A0ABP1R107_9HEXA